MGLNFNSEIKDVCLELRDLYAVEEKYAKILAQIKISKEALEAKLQELRKVKQEQEKANKEWESKQVKKDA